jgi:hypothetical protein
MAVQFGRDQAGSGTAGRGGHGLVSLGWVRPVEACRGGLVEASCVRARRVLMGPVKAVNNLCTKGE